MDPRGPYAGVGRAGDEEGTTGGGDAAMGRMPLDAHHWYTGLAQYVM